MGGRGESPGGLAQTEQLIVTLDTVAIAATFLIVLAVLVLDVTGRVRRAPYFRWQGAGLLLMFGVMFATQLAEDRGWPSSRLHALHSIEMPVILAGIAFVGVGLLVFARERGRRDTTHR
jgi:hypothetical protein